MALVLALRNRERYQSVSAFSPILSPSLVPWGEKAFSAYLGKDREKWQQYDASSLIQQGNKVQGMRIDQGLEDEFCQHNCAPKILSKPVVWQINRSMCVSTKATIIAITSSPVLLVSILPIMRHF